MIERSLPLLGGQEVVEERIITRDQFGEGEAGEWAYQTIRNGTRCEGKDPISGEACSNRASQTLDCDIYGTMEIFPNCGGSCVEVIRSGIEKDLAKVNIRTVFSMNGWGRKRA